MQHNDSYNDATYSFVNNIITPEGGTHLAGFRNALTKTFNTYARANKILKDTEPALTGDDIREGLTAIISIKIEEPRDRRSRSSATARREAPLTRLSASSSPTSWSRILRWRRTFVKNHCSRSARGKRREKRVISPEERPPSRECLFRASLPTVPTKTRRTARSLL